MISAKINPFICAVSIFLSLIAAVDAQARLTIVNASDTEIKAHIETTGVPSHFIMEKLGPGITTGVITDFPCKDKYNLLLRSSVGSLCVVEDLSCNKMSTVTYKAKGTSSISCVAQ